ncbi:riboflavin biosynthesis protein RibD [Hydrogenophilus thermoluteolus]|uniref:bifunctional diaminohydroxyphosphoribosylaminopyrimidine deaminase/5-amino-6-(5-phosphoribosylamino)uracil reductase RibD n=1 Tax=Hydrogenophilus thermoluteolus TaxID=297 RepID=UPI0024A4E817|nr:bifunctional diaminohydroxyphosphoribosylaminopyrimidine deaminase/5-amino-6-(5-phosphoribosylamino)uracil reductase RibD [Hydrogenophilus thermoluteolus]GLW59801.1 riboflavin biosynthesis protein RibD [Hydrogenophilus thermoluteolus]
MNDQFLAHVTATVSPQDASPFAQWMRRALRLARRGMNTTTPNPRVGCVLVAPDGTLVGEGWHERAGGPHAEIGALHQAGNRARGATAVVTLEPCAHHGKTPPCADALIAAGVTRVVYGMRDPNPLVAGKGLAKLAAAGIEVVGPVLEAECRALNPGFIRRMTAHRPAFFLKTAATLDGRIALANGMSRWITGEAARRDVHRWRARCCAVLTSIGTVLADDPLLTVRHRPALRQPIRIVLDSHLRIPENAQLVRDHHAPTWVITTDAANPEKIARLTQMGCTVHCLPTTVDGRIDLHALARWLAEQSLNEVLVEAGATLASAFLKNSLVDRWLHYLAPKAFGGDAYPLFPAWELTAVAAAPKWRIDRVRRLGDDLSLELVEPGNDCDEPHRAAP